MSISHGNSEISVASFIHPSPNLTPIQYVENSLYHCKKLLVILKSWFEGSCGSNEVIVCFEEFKEATNKVVEILKRSSVNCEDLNSEVVDLGDALSSLCSESREAIEANDTIKRSILNLAKILSHHKKSFSDTSLQDHASEIKIMLTEDVEKVTDNGSVETDYILQKMDKLQLSVSRSFLNLSSLQASQIADSEVETEHRKKKKGNKPLIHFFIEYENVTKRIQILGEYNLPDIHKKFQEKFKIVPCQGLFEVQDPNSNVFFELESVKDLTDYCRIRYSVLPEFDGFERLMDGIRRDMRQMISTQGKARSFKKIHCLLFQNARFYNELIEIFNNLNDEHHTSLRHMQELLKNEMKMQSRQARNTMVNEFTSLKEKSFIHSKNSSILGDIIERLKQDVLKKRCPTQEYVSELRNRLNQYLNEVSSLKTELENATTLSRAVWEKELERIVREKEEFKEVGAIIEDLENSENSMNNHLNSIQQFTELKKLKQFVKAKSSISMEDSHSMMLSEISMVDQSSQRRIDAIEDMYERKKQEQSFLQG